MEDGDLARAAREYQAVMPGLLRRAAAAVRSGQARSINDVIAVMDGGRKGAVERFGRLLDREFQALADDQGVLRDPAKAALVLDRAAGAMEGK